MLNNEIKVSKQIGNHTVSLSTGKMAKQANGAVAIQCGNTVIMAAITAAKEPREGADFFPLTIEYSEKMYAAGKIPGGFFKREAKPRTGATLAARLTDRPLRPCFPKEFLNEVQVIINVLSADSAHSPEYLGIIAASAALSVSDIPFNGPVGAALVALKNGQFIYNPSDEELKDSDLDIVVAGTKDAILMVEAGASEVSEDDIIKAIEFAHENIKESIALQEELMALSPKKEKMPVPEAIKDDAIESQINALIGSQIEDNLQAGNKTEIDGFLSQLKESVLAELVDEEGDNKAIVNTLFDRIKKDKIRKTIIQKKVRPDGRRTDEIRPIETEVTLLPSAHGSALFTRGETQSLGVTTLGTASDELMEDGLKETRKSNYFFHYNFPPYSVGEVGFFARTSRRELGHGALAERAIKSILPSAEDFPYTIRIVSEIFESNGSSSMASVCSGTLSLMDCGVPIKAPVSGIAMGLLIDGDDYTILSDIQGLEDHYGDMDFKVAGSERGITALQLDIKVGGLSKEILSNSLEQAKEGRLHILSKMLETISQSREELPDHAPQIESLTVNPEKIGVIIGPGGKMIRKIEEESGATVEIDDETPGIVRVCGTSGTAIKAAKEMILGLVKEIEKGETYNGKVVRTTNFGAFIELLPGKDGLLHISKISKERIDRVEDVLNVGDMIEVTVEDIDKQNRVSLVRA